MSDMYTYQEQEPLTTPLTLPAQREQFVLSLARALHSAGAPAHRLEARMGGVAHALGMRCDFFATPTAVIVDLGDRSRVLRVRPRDAHLERLIDLDHIAAQVEQRRMTAAEGLRALDEVARRAERYSPHTHLGAMAAAGGAAAVFFRGSWGDMLGAALVSVGVGWLFARCTRSARTADIAPLLGATLAALLASLLVRLLPASPELLVLGGLIVFVPGLSITTALAELSTQHLAAGTARLAASLVFLLQLGLGAGLGLQLGQHLPAAPLAPGAPVPVWTSAVAVPVITAAFLVLFRGRPKDLPWVLGVCALAWWSTSRGVALLGAGLGPGVGALLVGLASNLQARVRDLPASVTLLPGLLLLVPGSMGFRSFRALADAQTNAQTADGVHAAFTMFLVAAALVAGLLAANALLPAKRDL